MLPMMSRSASALVRFAKGLQTGHLCEIEGRSDGIGSVEGGHLLSVAEWSTSVLRACFVLR